MSAAVRKRPRKVYVVIGYDIPFAVFSTAGRADKYIQELKDTYLGIKVDWRRCPLIVDRKPAFVRVPTT